MNNILIHDLTLWEGESCGIFISGNHLTLSSQTPSTADMSSGILVSGD